MKLRAEISGNEHQIVLNLGEGRFDVDDRQYDVDVQQVGPGEYLLKSGDSVYKCRVETKHGAGAGMVSFAVAVRGRSYDVTIIDPKRLRSGQTSASHHAGAAEIVSPMPGKIVRVLVEAGASVEAGTGVIVVEAMKMQNEMKSPKSGTIVSINVAVGATVNGGDLLAVVE